MTLLEDIKIAPSILSADIAHLGADIAAIDTADYVHIDVMDGHFVPNLTFGPNVVHTVKEVSPLPADVHLMISNPDEMVSQYLEAGADIVTFHAEAATHAHRIVMAIHEAGALAGISLNPATPVSVLDAIIEDLDLVLIMSVNPGFGGQSFIAQTLRKLRQVKALAHTYGVSPLIEVDGGICAENAAHIVEAGANVLVAGSAVYGATDRGEAVRALREAGRAGLTRRA